MQVNINVAAVLVEAPAAAMARLAAEAIKVQAAGPAQSLSLSMKVVRCLCFADCRNGALIITNSKRCEIVNVCQLERFEDGATVGVEQLSGAGLIDSIKSRVKILGKGDLTKKLQVTAHKFSKNAEQKIAASGGIVKMV